MTDKEKPSQEITRAADSPNAFVAFKGAMRAIYEESPEILTGVLGSVLPQALIPVRIFHATAKGQFLRQLMAETEELRKKGSIKEDFLKSEQAWACFSDLFDYLDKTSPDPKRLEAIKAAFLRILKNGSGADDSPHAQQLLRVVCELSAGEIAVLATLYRMGSGGQQPVRTWLADVANASRISSTEIVEGIEHTLIGKRIIFARDNGSPSFPPQTPMVIWGSRNRLTQLGIEVCEYMTQPAQ